MKPIKFFNLFLTVVTLLLTGTVNSESFTAHKNYSYDVDFDDPQSQSEALDNIQRQIENEKNDEELKVILFGRGKALSLNANALKSTEIKYENTDEAIQKKVSELNRRGIRLIICKNPSSSRRHYSTRPTATTVEKERQHLESQGYNCN